MHLGRLDQLVLRAAVFRLVRFDSGVEPAGGGAALELRMAESSFRQSSAARPFGTVDGTVARKRKL